MVAHALDSLGLQFGFAERRQQHRRENRDDGDDDEQFNQSEAAPSPKRGVLGKRPRLWEACLQVAPPDEGVTFRDIRGDGVRVGFHCSFIIPCWISFYGERCAFAPCPDPEILCIRGVHGRDMTNIGRLRWGQAFSNPVNE